ncbi:hypothetical protein Nepgr_015014 [Nepenthes gracilis]|uniref:Major facilitator superfamily (MFS) profile domain-containing protein n=1 Tax=Nepenthes gracilis TaxID=150966 RepID=A0AAD3SKK2_NEPGR|nr:hypothetical protein Nepgr_015014 [Nepenthes gracilis]
MEGDGGRREESMGAHLLDEKRESDSSVTGVLLFSIFTAVCGSLVCGCAVGYTSPVESAMMADLGLSTAEFSLFGSLLTVGGLLGSLVSGKIADYIGRKRTMGLSDILCLIGWLAIACSQGAWSLDLGRVLLGFGLGLTVFVVPVYIGEIAPKDLRGGSVLVHQLVICFGISLMFFVGLVITWRILALIGIIPCLMQLLFTFFIPESPRWLVKIGQDKEFEAALHCLRGIMLMYLLKQLTSKSILQPFKRYQKPTSCICFRKNMHMHSLLDLG